VSAGQNLHVMLGSDYVGFTPRITMALRGTSVLSDPPSRKEPITFSLLSDMIYLLEGRLDRFMLTAAMSVAFCGCFFSGEFCTQAGLAFNPGLSLCVRYVFFLLLERMLSLTLTLFRDRCSV
jgi:hypothetical protein